MQASNNQAQIQSIREANQLNPATGKVEPYMVVTFKVGTHGPFTESFPKAGFDPNHINGKLAEFAGKLGMVQGQ